MSKNAKLQEIETIYQALKNNFMLYIKDEITEDLFENNEVTLKVRLKGLI